MNIDDKPSHEPSLPVQTQMFGKPYKTSGGRCRARTYDPLIKSQLACIDFAWEFFKPRSFVPNIDQWLTAILQTGKARP